MASFLSQSGVLWLRVSGLAAVQAAISLTWLVYNFYLPQLLVQAGLPKEFAMGLLVVENLLAVLMEPLMGGLSDLRQKWLGSRFPFISVGVVLASALFIAIPAYVVLGHPTAALRWGLLVLLVGWSLAMTVFRSPALSLLGRYAFASQLPQAASLLTLAGGLVGAVGAVANQQILSLGSMVAFAIGSCVLLGSAAVLRWADPDRGTSSPARKQAPPPIFLPALGMIAGTGAGITLGFLTLRSLLNANPAQAATVLGCFTLFHLLSILPAGFVASRLGNSRVMVAGLAGLILLLPALGLAAGMGGMAIVAGLLGLTFSFVINGSVPFALSLVPSERAGLGTGLYFGGAALAASLFASSTPLLSALPPLGTALVGAIAFLVAGLCIAASLRLQPLQTRST